MNTYTGLSFPHWSLSNLKSTADEECIKSLQFLYKLQDSQFEITLKNVNNKSCKVWIYFKVIPYLSDEYGILQAFQQTETFSTFCFF